MSELAYSLDGHNAHYSTPLNAAAPGRNTGGSSSGSAVSGGKGSPLLLLTRTYHKRNTCESSDGNNAHHGTPPNMQHLSGTLGAQAQAQLSVCVPLYKTDTVLATQSHTKGLVGKLLLNRILKQLLTV